MVPIGPQHLQFVLFCTIGDKIWLIHSSIPFIFFPLDGPPDRSLGCWALSRGTQDPWNPQ